MPRATLEEIGQAELPVPVLGQSGELMRPARLGQPCVKARLHVDPVVTRPLGPGDRKSAGTAQVISEQPADRIVRGPRCGHGTWDHSPGQPANVRKLRLVSWPAAARPRGGMGAP
jgi:hypothetical protein